MSLSMKAARARRGAYGPGVRYGDPGIFSFLGKAAKAAVGGAVGFATGGVQGAVRGAVSPFVSQPRPPQLPLPSPTGTVIPFPGPGSLQVDPLAALPGGRPFTSRVATNGDSGSRLACPSGYHANRADYFLKDGTFVPKGTRCVKNRSRNPLNPRALRRAVGRVEAGKTWQGKLREIETAKWSKAGNRKD